MIKRIGCLDCISTNCDGCNLKNLEEMLNSGRLDILMDDYHTIDPHTEVVPVKHGEWVWCKDHWECTNCRGSRYHDLVLGLDAAYCGRCGAKMRGGAEG